MGDDEGNAPSLAEGEDVVRVMTVHQAKGLEFPVVVLAGLCSDPPGYKAGEILVGSDGRMAARIMVPSNSPDRPGWGPVDAIIDEQKRRKAEEDIRVLYVAMTRARDQLILVGSRSFDDKPESFRIGKIITALGLATPPAPGVSVPLDDIHAVVTGVAPVPAAAGGSAATGSARREAEVAGPPCLLDLPGRSFGVRHVSFSALAAYDRCPRRFYLDRVLGLGLSSPPGVSAHHSDGEHADPESASAEEGRLDDAEASTRYRGGHRGARPARAAGSRRREAGHGWVVGPGEHRGGREGPQCHGGGSRAGCSSRTGLLGTPPRRNSQAARAKHEAPFFFVQDGVAVSGVMDLLVQDGDRWLVVDYKSNALGRRSPAEAAEAYSPAGGHVLPGGSQGGRPGGPHGVRLPRARRASRWCSNTGRMTCRPWNPGLKTPSRASEPSDFSARDGAGLCRLWREKCL